MNPFALEARIKEYADQAATSFLAPLSEKRASPDYVSKNVEAILRDSGNDLSVEVAKIASEENLNPHTVARVCEEANKEVFARIYKGSTDKTAEFKVADATSVLASLNRSYQGPGDLHLPVEHPRMSKAACFEKAASDKKDEVGCGSWAKTALFPSDLQKAQMTLDQEKMAKEVLNEGLHESRALKDQAALDFLKISRDLMLEGGRTPSELFAMVKEARPASPAHEAAARELLALVSLACDKKFPEGADLVVKLGYQILSQTGGGQMPSEDLRTVSKDDYEFWTKSPGVRAEDLISPVSSSGAPVVINGHHAIFMSLDTLIDQTGKENWWGKGLLFSGDRVNTAVKQIVNWTHKTENIHI